MIIRKNVHSSSLEFKPLVVDVDTVYENFNESKLFDEETKKHIGYKYDQIQYDKDEFIALISEKNKQLNSVIEEILFDIIPTLGGMGGE